MTVPRPAKSGPGGCGLSNRYPARPTPCDWSCQMPRPNLGSTGAPPGANRTLGRQQARAGAPARVGSDMNLSKGCRHEAFGDQGQRQSSAAISCRPAQSPDKGRLRSHDQTAAIRVRLSPVRGPSALRVSGASTIPIRQARATAVGCSWERGGCLDDRDSEATISDRGRPRRDGADECQSRGRPRSALRDLGTDSRVEAPIIRLDISKDRPEQQNIAASL
jgi:hypothetical protein